MFVPRGGGMIVPNGASRGMGAGAIEQNVVINDYSGQAKVRQKQTPEGGGVECHPGHRSNAGVGRRHEGAAR